MSFLNSTHHQQQVDPVDTHNAITKQYIRLFEMEGCELEFREDALRAVAKKSMERKTGARGLRSIMENVLLDTMYDLPSTDDVTKVVIDAGSDDSHKSSPLDERLL